MLYFIIVYILILWVQQGDHCFTYYPYTYVLPEKKSNKSYRENIKGVCGLFGAHNRTVNGDNFVFALNVCLIPCTRVQSLKSVV